MHEVTGTRKIRRLFVIRENQDKEKVLVCFGSIFPGSTVTGADYHLCCCCRQVAFNFLVFIQKGHTQSSRCTVANLKLRRRVRFARERMDSNSSIVYKTWRIYRIEPSKGLQGTRTPIMISTRVQTQRLIDLHPASQMDDHSLRATQEPRHSNRNQSELTSHMFATRLRRLLLFASLPLPTRTQ